MIIKLLFVVIKKITRIAGYSATSTECSDYSLKKLPKKECFFFKNVSLFVGVV